MNIQAKELNDIIKIISETTYPLLSKKGKNIFFPKQGILSQSTEAKGKKINATIGMALESDGNPMCLNSVAKQINAPSSSIFPYAPSSGIIPLRKQWKSMMYEKNPSLTGKEISLPVVTSALTHGLTLLGYLFVDPNDIIIMPDLYWENYDLIFKNAYGAQFDLFPLFDNNRFNIHSLSEKLLENSYSKKILLLNFPNNPTGYTPYKTEIRQILDVVKESAEKGNKLLVIVDDAYFGLVYEKEIEEESIFTYLADLHENVMAVKIDGATKEDYVWGFRIGFITYGTKSNSQEFYQALELKTSGAIRGTISNSSNVSQNLLMNAFDSKTYKEEKIAKYKILKERYLIVKNTLEKNERYTDYFFPLPFNSGYFMCIRLNSEINSEKVRKLLLEKYDTGVICFENIIRIAYSSVSEKNIPILFANIYNACKDLMIKKI